MKRLIIIIPFALCLAILITLSYTKERVGENGDIQSIYTSDINSANTNDIQSIYTNDVQSVTTPSPSRGGLGRGAEGAGGLLLGATPVKNQGHTEACWIYAYLACIETERIEQFSDSLNLSPLWLINSLAHEQAVRQYLCKGKGKISLRGIGPDAERLMKQYGMVPYSFFHTTEDISSNMIERDITMKVNIAINAKKGLSALRDDVSTALPRVPHNLEHGFYLYGMHYTPRQFGESLLAGTSMQWLTSYTHHPFNEPFCIELPDNQRNHCIMNIPIDSLYRRVVAALKAHHPVFWEGKMKPVENIQTMKVPSAKNFAGDKSLRSANYFSAIQSFRQRAFEAFSVGDDHAMAIIGITKDKNGQPLFICKNSWGKEWGHKGYCLMTAEQFLINTVLVGVFVAP